MNVKILGKTHRRIVLLVLMLAIIACTCGPLAGLTGNQEETVESETPTCTSSAVLDTFYVELMEAFPNSLL